MSGRLALLDGTAQMLEEWTFSGVQMTLKANDLSDWPASNDIIVDWQIDYESCEWKHGHPVYSGLGGIIV